MAQHPANKVNGFIRRFGDAQQTDKSERVASRGTESVCGRIESDTGRMQTSVQEALTTFSPQFATQFNSLPSPTSALPLTQYILQPSDKMDNTSLQSDPMLQRIRF